MLPPEVLVDSDGMGRGGRIRRADEYVEKAREIAGAVENDPSKLDDFFRLIFTRKRHRCLRGKKLYEWCIASAQADYTSAGLTVLAESLAHVATLELGLGQGGWRDFLGGLLWNNREEGWWHDSAERVRQ